MRETARRLLVWGLGGTVLLPVVLAVVFGLGGLLASLGDTSGAAICRGVALAVGAAWIVSLAGTVLATAVVTLESAGGLPSRPFDAAGGNDAGTAEPRPTASRPDSF